MSDFERECKAYSGNCHTHRTIHMMGPDGADAEFQNLYIREGSGSSAGSTIHRDDLIALRDALIEQYPLEHSINPKREFSVGTWEFEFGFPVMERVQRQGVDVKTIGYFPERHNADWAVQALNERNKREAA